MAPQAVKRREEARKSMIVGRRSVVMGLDYTACPVRFVKDSLNFRRIAGGWQWACRRCGSYESRDAR